MNDINNPKKMAGLYEGVKPSVPMNSAVLGVFALFLHYLGYISIACFIGTYSYVLGVILFVCASLFAILGAGHHVKYALSVWMFIKGDRDEKSYELFTVLPIFVVLFPFKIIGSLHLSAIITFLGWIFFV